MTITVLEGKRFAEMVIQGANHLSSNANYVDALNVFPVPDGDTGTNMNLSMTSGAKEVQNNIQSHIGKVGVSLSKGLLMGARGNSGVILSQLFRGFSKSIEQKESITAQEFANALQFGVETAYKAVMKPVEGTILTVAKDAAKKAVKSAEKTDDITEVLTDVVTEAKASLNRTPELLPVLKEVGVVDSGGQGLVFVYEGFLSVLTGEELPETVQQTVSMNDLVNAEHHKNVHGFMNTEDIEFGYCTEFMVRLEEDKLEGKPFSEDQFRQDLSKYGDSLLVIADDEVVKIHIHSNLPGEVLTFGQKYGNLIKMKIENMREQHSSLVEGSKESFDAPTQKREELKEYGIVTVSMGSGIADMFRSIGAHSVIEGGQTMNPSTEDIVNAVKKVHAKKVFILPNNKNIIMAAEQAAQVLEEDVAVIPSKTVPQGMSALLAFNPTSDMESNKKGMIAALEHVKTGQITYAVRDTTIDGLQIETGDFMGIADGKIVAKGKDKAQSAKELLSTMIDEDSEILTIIKGEDALDEELEAIVSFVEDKFEDVEVEIHDGKQPLYSFIFSVE
ncbi:MULTISPECIES: DAK2 domain-containing protein [Bacillaceae]|uniref:DAK2 domain-containing protein n=1 Tax=Bacillaceae TaxID=186817 RepID=UPI001E4D16BA|nr:MULTISPECIES: DAK2 domain-containing protein [Bacillaceae]MCE4048354.1 DAK2 domain-containing protein [Bacillus sp. Au-Bac7]MCM3029027.1 DAK2 domain-containing protein [Niallia sp. MER 6]MDL0435086.1 DAK2 domain-containing protein [Niallia sp. SS-2023]UPO88888.1 DAK2 domain-containing protein [Niallia sp. Man26]